MRLISTVRSQGDMILVYFVILKIGVHLSRPLLCKEMKIIVKAFAAIQNMFAKKGLIAQLVSEVSGTILLTLKT